MDSPSTAENPEPQVVFRPSKKRKQFRQRAEDNAPPPEDATGQAAGAASSRPAQDSSLKLHHGNDDAASETGDLSVAEVLRLRNARKSRPKGVEFRPEGAPKDETPAEAALLPGDDAQNSDATELGMSRRFAPQAGLVGELVNKHM